VTTLDELGRTSVSSTALLEPAQLRQGKSEHAFDEWITPWAAFH